MTRARHRRQDVPRVVDRVVGLERLVGRREHAVRDFPTRYVDLAVVGRRTAAAARRRHPLLHDTPEIGRRVVLFDHVDVGDESDIARGDASANHIDLVVDDAGVRVITGGRHRAPLGPRVRNRVIHLVAPADAVTLAVLEGLESSDDVNLAVHRFRLRGTALDWQRRQRLVRIGDGIVLPDVGSGAFTRDGSQAAAENVQLAVVGGLRLVMHVDRNVLLLRPLVRPGVVLVYESRRTAAARPGRRGAAATAGTRAGWIEAESTNDIELAVDDGAVELFLRLGERRRFRPAHATRRRILRADRGAHRERHDRCNCSECEQAFHQNVNRTPSCACRFG